MYEMKELFSDLWYLEFEDGVESEMLDARHEGDKRIMDMLDHTGSHREMFAMAEVFVHDIADEEKRKAAEDRIEIARRLLGPEFEDVSDSASWASAVILSMTAIYCRIHRGDKKR